MWGKFETGALATSGSERERRNTIKEQIKKLYDLSKYTVEMHDIEMEIDAIPKKIATLESEIMDSCREFDEASNRLEELNKTYREKEIELEDVRKHVKESESKLYMIKTNKEYQAAVTEIAERKRHSRDLENEMLRIMEEKEELEPRVKEQKPAIDDKMQSLAEEKSKLESNIEQLKNELAEKKESWRKLTSDIDEKLFRKYESARRLNPDVIAILERNTCQGCYMSVPPQLAIEILRFETLHSCPNCQRLLFIKEAMEEGTDPPA